MSRIKKMSWDDRLPEAVSEEWRQYQEQLESLKEFRIPRCVIVPETISVEFHCFSDASMVA